MNCLAFRKLNVIILLFVLVPFISPASIVVLNGLTHENQAGAGESYRGIIQVQNASDKNRSVRIYQRDYWFSHTGESKHDAGGTLERSNADWITFQPELLDLGPHETTTINFEVKVPALSLSGTYWSVIMVEGITPPDTSRQSGGVTINTAIRYAVQIVTNIGQTGTRDIQFLGLELGQQDETPILNVALENTGERVLRPELAAELFDAEGNSVGVIKGDSRKVFPGTSVMISLKLEGIRPGNYTGILVADCGDDHVFGTNVSLEI